MFVYQVLEFLTVIFGYTKEFVHVGVGSFQFNFIEQTEIVFVCQGRVIGQNDIQGFIKLFEQILELIPDINRRQKLNGFINIRLAMLGANNTQGLEKRLL